MNPKYICSLLAVFSVKYIVCDSLPCDFLDSVNITSGIRDSAGNIIHNNILYKPKYYRVIDYYYEDFSQKKFVAEYTRGCPCAVRLCVRMCCPHKHVFNGKLCVPTDGPLEVMVNTTLYNSQRNYELVDLAQNPMYGFLYGKPCQFVYRLDPAAVEADEWFFARVSFYFTHSDLFAVEMIDLK